VEDMTNPPLANPGAPEGNGNAGKALMDEGDENNVDNVNIVLNEGTMGGNDASYLTRRLKRDRPDLAEKVIRRSAEWSRGVGRRGIVTRPRSQTSQSA
jgi:hypothetical protein